MIKTIELVLLPEEAANEQSVKDFSAKKLRLLPAAISGIYIRKRSIDARAKQVRIRLQVDVYCGEKFSAPVVSQRDYKNVTAGKQVIIVGCGPAGMFAALRLIELGFKPIIIERGKNVKDRRRDLAAINKQGIVNPDSNYCFGEGGAGTYSDGKLYTRSGKRGSIERILEIFVSFGADQTILAEAHPHIGTNKLPKIISAMREMILQCGGEILFETKLTAVKTANNKLKGIYINSTAKPSEPTFIATDNLLLATGHSARDVFELLQTANILIEAKPLAIGVRIEHHQSLIDSIQYHCTSRGEFLPPASYSLVHQANDRGVYSFCMCPGGIIAPAATAPGEVVVNGWSPSKRNNPFANSGIVVSIAPDDYKPYQKYGALACLKYQAAIEQKAFAVAGHSIKAPAQRMIDFTQRKFSNSLPPTSYLPGTVSATLDEVLTPEISSALRNGLIAFGKKMKGYLTNEAVLVGVESRTSSPVRIPRDADTLMHPQLEGLFPCGEGAGYAGGIVSAAIDGERVADKIVGWISD